MICPSCQTENNQDAKFCIKCGAALTIRPLGEVPNNEVGTKKDVKNQINQFFGNKRNILITIMILALAVAGGYYWNAHNTTRAIAGRWKLTSVNGKRAVGTADAFTVEKDGEMTYEVTYGPLESRITGITLEKVDDIYTITHPENIRIQPVNNKQYVFEDVARDGFMTKIDAHNYRLSDQNVRQIQRLSGNTWTESVNQTVLTLNLLLNQKANLMKIGDGQVQLSSVNIGKDRMKDIYTKID